MSSVADFTPKQQEFINAAFSGKYNYLAFGGAIRGGKSVVALSLVVMLAKIFPRSRWAIVRKDLMTLRRTTIQSFEKIKPRPFVGDLYHSLWTYYCANGSEIVLFPENWEQDKDLERWKGLEVNGFVLEEASELQEATFNKAIERAGSWKCPGEQPPPYVFITCNPANNWVKRRFYTPWDKGLLEAPYFYLPSKIFDNPHVDAAYVESLKNLPPAEYERFVNGSWDSLDDPQQLIKYEWLLAAADEVEVLPGNTYLGVDVARYGDDHSAIAHRTGNALTKIERYHGLSTTQLGDLVATRINEFKVAPARVGVDVVGLGAGTVDSLTAKGFSVRSVNGGAGQVIQSGSEFRFKNMRSQLWWLFREALRKKEIAFDLPREQIARLFEDLSAPRYAIAGDKTVTVESKDDFKKRLGRSPDEADAVINAWVSLTGEPVTSIDFGEPTRANPSTRI